ncbi:hypothetical protein Ae201684_012880 [Aphanomyces euteiches]|uniref:Jacalin-type lectin domain-containing protein n=1 Tax=Aphanomyces euteiches TaxID=100861 RepID=A0A6G0WQE2_9STRA|nr:hypothetical protein Ae201684_012880 [Aphanomyces euteiches]
MHARGRSKDSHSSSSAVKSSTARCMEHDGPYLSRMVGGSIGGTASRNLTKGVLSFISGQATSSVVIFLELAFTDGTLVTLGRRLDRSDTCQESFSFEDGERMTRCILHRNQAGSEALVADPDARLAAISFTTSHGRSFQLSGKKWPDADKFELDVGSGLAVGVKARSFAEVDAFSFVFLEPVVQFHYMDAIPAKAAHPHRTVIHTTTKCIDNTTDHAKEHAEEVTLSTTRSCAHTSLGAVVGTNLRTFSTAPTTPTESRTINQTTEVPPRERVQVTTTVSTFQVEIPLTKEIHAVCVNGSHALKYRGVYSAEWNEATVEFERRGFLQYVFTSEGLRDVD